MDRVATVSAVVVLLIVIGFVAPVLGGIIIISLEISRLKRTLAALGKKTGEIVSSLKTAKTAVWFGCSGLMLAVLGLIAWKEDWLLWLFFVLVSTSGLLLGIRLILFGKHDGIYEKGIIIGGIDLCWKDIIKCEAIENKVRIIGEQDIKDYKILNDTKMVVEKINMEINLSKKK